MSVNNLGQVIDLLALQESAFVLETVSAITVSNLDHASVGLILRENEELNWTIVLFDGADEACTVESADVNMEPFRLIISKPVDPANVLQIVTLEGLRKFLSSNSENSKWYVAGLTERVVTFGRALCPWGDTFSFAPRPALKSPRSLVKEYTGDRTVPADIGLWMLQDLEFVFSETPAYLIWKSASIKAIACSIASEIDHENASLKFSGSVKLSLKMPDDINGLSSKFSAKQFNNLQIAIAWIFENDREAESRHILLATEIARTSNADAEFVGCLGGQILSSLDGAKIAYQMMLSDLSKDTLKSLGDLRKAINEEVAKVTDATRQLVAGIAGALTVGFGLIAARMTTNTSPLLISSVMIVVAVYVGVLIFSGVQFIKIQRSLREEWQFKIYRFLSSTDYKKMVSDPASRSENTFIVSAVLSGVAVGVLTISILFLSFFRPLSDNANPENTNQKNTVFSSSSLRVSSTSASSRVTVVSPTKQLSSSSFSSVKSKN